MALTILPNPIHNCGIDSQLAFGTHCPRFLWMNPPVDQVFHWHHQLFVCYDSYESWVMGRRVRYRLALAG
jgi:hypothetical protein